MELVSKLDFCFLTRWQSGRAVQLSCL